AGDEVRRRRPPEAIGGVIGERVTVPRSALAITSAPPSRWSVVPRPKNPGRFPGGSQYVVCPNCRERVPLEEHPALMQCRRCEAVSDIAWDESYFAEA